jgi:hypothetical protein
MLVLRISFVCTHAEFTEQGGLDAAQELLDRRPALTAAFVASLPQAIGVRAAASERGLDVAHQLSLVAYDELPLVRFLDPPLTTVRVPLEELGETALRSLHAQIGRAARGADHPDRGASRRPAIDRRGFMTELEDLYNRGHGAALALGSDATALMTEMLGRETGTCAGRGGSMYVIDHTVVVASSAGFPMPDPFVA